MRVTTLGHYARAADPVMIIQTAGPTLAELRPIVPADLGPKILVKL